MPTFRHTGVDERYYTDIGVHAVPGKTADFDEAPDAMWEPAYVVGEGEPELIHLPHVTPDEQKD